MKKRREKKIDSIRKKKEKNNNFSKNTLNLIEKSKKINISCNIFYYERY